MRWCRGRGECGTGRDGDRAAGIDRSRCLRTPGRREAIAVGFARAVLVTLRMDGKRESQTILVKTVIVAANPADQEDEESDVTKGLRQDAAQEPWTPAAGSNP